MMLNLNLYLSSETDHDWCSSCRIMAQWLRDRSCLYFLFFRALAPLSNWKLFPHSLLCPSETLFDVCLVRISSKENKNTLEYFFFFFFMVKGARNKGSGKCQYLNISAFMLSASKLNSRIKYSKKNKTSRGVIRGTAIHISSEFCQVFLCALLLSAYQK